MTAQETHFIQIVETTLDKLLDKKLEVFATKQYIDERLKGFATKDDIKGFATEQYIDDKLKGFATREDLKTFATKDDLEAFATKDDLKAFATKVDLIGLEQRLSRKIMESRDINIQHHLETRELVGKLESEVGGIKDKLRALAEI